tara:strand:- start:184 stop:699 length:516 start_codon:yes stop_codon:yes gene_type:complete
MPLLNILKYPDSRLKNVAQKVVSFNKDLSKIVSDMSETMYKAPGIGLAATQVNINKEIIVIDISEKRDNLLVLINPEIIWTSENKKFYEEGCLSIPGIYENVCRPSEIKVKSYNLEGKVFEISADGLLSVCIQHEMDHLVGKVFVDYLSTLKRSRIKSKLLKEERELKKIA